MQDKVEITERLLTELLSCKAPDNWLKEQNLSNEDFDFLLLLAVEKKELKTTAFLCLNCPFVFDTFPLIEKAVENGYLDLLKFFCFLPKADPSVKENYAIGYAAAKGYLDIVIFLSTHPQVIESNGIYTAFCHAVCFNQVNVAEVSYELISQTLTSSDKNHAFVLAAQNGHLEMVKFLLKIPDLDPSANDNSALRETARCATGSGFNHKPRLCLKVVKFLCTLPNVNPAARNHEALYYCGLYGPKEIAQHLASLPSYNPYAQGISAQEKKTIIDLLTKFDLESVLAIHEKKARQEAAQQASKSYTHLSFLFFNKSTAFECLGSDLTRLVAQIRIEVDSKELSSYMSKI